ncbi:1-phosphatidylinositol 4,5-bisphosphate phosphodiesterase beta-2 [Bagarius yarrelli]|uniref:1-phosphatidylinositol 4,5-bisphosphate phosphodiesterase n=1 Tax=Bagarius yarrelli TaxID=175774 RepID=A0A556V9U4_BAGYA|nr:1-phosphatidylinositol 4,5-bisphosphate phosphodiesterase beta-2 [Bagarius yarrelli]
MLRKRYVLHEPEIKDYLVKGDRFTKWKEDSSRTTPVTMKMDPKGYFLYWINSSKEVEILDMATIRDTRTGKYAKLPKHQKVRNTFNMDFPDSNHLSKTLTIVTGPDIVNLTYYNFFATKEKVAQNWAEDILAIIYNPHRANSCRQVYLEKIYVRLTLQTNKDGKIPVKYIYKMFPADKKRVESALSAAKLPKGKFDSIKPEVFTEAAFKTFLMNLCPRPEIYEIFSTYSSKPYMTKEVFTKFLYEKQRDSRLNQELYPPPRPDQVKAFIDKYEPSSTNSNRGQITPEGFLFFLMGPETTSVMLDKLAQCHDMTQPIPHYYIKSSHNTYLTAGQFSGPSSPEMYRQCLLSGCRCLELDCWKGKPPDEEPIITHGFTMTTEILFKDVIEAIAESAFKTSKYPVILSFENHVDTVKQQEKMANYCRTIFGDALLSEPLEKYPLKPGHQIPSPAELMGKILIKNKKGPTGAAKPPPQKKTQEEGHAENTGEHTENTENQNGEHEEHHDDHHDDHHDEHHEDEEQDEEKMKNSDEGTAGQEVKAFEAMSSIVNYIQPHKFISFEVSRNKNKSYAISSFVETKGEHFISKNAVEFVEYNKRQMSRIYPKGTRMDSSNYNPQPFWNVGCQMVALNYQTMDFPMQLNMAMFEYNGRTGYLLKNDVMRRNDKLFDPFSDKLDTNVPNTLSIKIYSGQFLSDKNVKTAVEVEIIGLPGDPKKKFRTKTTATPNAINPVWNEEPFVFEKILLTELASVRIVVYEEGGKFLGHRIIPIDAIQSGFHHLCLRSESNMPLMLPSLFVYIEVKDYIPAAFAVPEGKEDPAEVVAKSSETPASEPTEGENLPAPADQETQDSEAPATSEEAPTTEAPLATNASLPDEEALPTEAPPPVEEAPPTEAPSATEEVLPTEALPPVEEAPPTEATLFAEEAPPTEEPAPKEEALPTEAVAEEASQETPAPSETPEAENPTNPNGEPTANVELEPQINADSAPSVEQDAPLVDSAAPAEIAATVQSAETPTAADLAGAAPEGSGLCGALELASVTCDELQQHKNYLKLTKKQEKELKEMEKKFQKKSEELTQKYSDLCKSLKKKTSSKRNDAGSEGSNAEQIEELKIKLRAELRLLWVEQYDQLKKKKEQHASECLTKLLEMATERHANQLKTLNSDSKVGKKKEAKSLGSEKNSLKKSKSKEQLDNNDDTQAASIDQKSSQELEQKMKKKQAETLADIRAVNSQMNQQAVSEHAMKMWSLLGDLKEAVNACVGPHFPEHTDKTEDSKPQQDGQFGQIYRG